MSNEERALLELTLIGAIVIIGVADWVHTWVSRAKRLVRHAH